MSEDTCTPNWTALVVDDDDGDALLLSRLLSAGGGSFRTEVCATLSDAVGWLEKHEADLVLLDQSLPDGHGLECITRIRQQNDDVPIVMLTGLNDREMADRAIEHGAADYLVKGELGPEELVQALQRAVKA